MEQNKRQQFVDMAKVISIIIVVMNHANLILPGINFWGGMFYVPAFFLISGYTYTPRKEKIKSFLNRKWKRLLIPYLCTNAFLFFFFFMKNLVTHTFNMQTTLESIIGIVFARNQLLKCEANLVIWKAPCENHYFMNILNAPTWFLPALFLLIVIAEVIYRVTKGDKKKICIFLSSSLILFLLYHYLSPYLLPWCFDLLSILLIYFFLGYFLRKENIIQRTMDHPKHKEITAILVFVALMISSGLLNGSTNLSISYFGHSIMLGLISGVSSSILLLFICYTCSIKFPKLTCKIAALSKYTLVILCLHYFVLQMLYTALNVLGISLEEQNVVVILIKIAAVIASILFCVVVTMIWNRFKIRRKHDSSRQ